MQLSQAYSGGILSVVVPAYNEAHTLTALLDRVFASEPGAGIRVEAVVVNDASTDAGIHHGFEGFFQGRAGAKAVISEGGEAIGSSLKVNKRDNSGLM